MNKKILRILFLAFVFRLILAFVIWHPDVRNHMDWGIRFFQYGAAKFYAPETNVWSFTWPNQPPGTIYLFAGIFKLFKFIFSIFWWINISIPPFPSGIITYFESNLYPALLKLPGILSDFGIAYLIYKIILEVATHSKLRFALKTIGKNPKNIAVMGSMIFLFNPVIWYNSSVWGQYDSFVTFLALLAFYLLLKKKVILATVFFSLSIYTKATLVIFLPIFFIIWIKQKYGFKRYLLSIIVPIVLIGFLTYPFSQSEPYSWLYRLYKDRVFLQQRQVVTSNAFNIWAGLTGIHQISHDNLFGPLSYKIWGMILFVASYLAPLYLVIKKKDFKSVIWALAIISISYFSILTNMHERYLFSFFPFLTIIAVFDKKIFLFYILISILNLLNLYNFWWVPEIGFMKNFLSYNGAYYTRILGYLEFAMFIYFYYIFIDYLGFRKKSIIKFRKLKK